MPELAASMSMRRAIRDTAASRHAGSVYATRGAGWPPIAASQASTAFARSPLSFAVRLSARAKDLSPPSSATTSPLPPSRPRRPHTPCAPHRAPKGRPPREQRTYLGRAALLHRLGRPHGGAGRTRHARVLADRERRARG